MFLMNHLIMNLVLEFIFETLSKFRFPKKVFRFIFLYIFWIFSEFIHEMIIAIGLEFGILVTWIKGAASESILNSSANITFYLLFSYSNSTSLFTLYTASTIIINFRLSSLFMTKVRTYMNKPYM